MEPSENAEIVQIGPSTLWFDESGILCSKSKKAPQRTMVDMKKTMDDFYKFIKGKKVCMLLDVTNSQPSTREVREYAAKEFPKFTKAIAFISKSALGKMVANVFFALKKQPYPVKMFVSEEEAKQWLKQHL